MTSITFWGLTASPYQLKMQSIADFAELDWKRLPQQGGVAGNLRFLLGLRAARASGAVERFPQREADMDEYPAVPYYTLDGNHFYYDSTGLANHLEALDLVPEPLVPAQHPERFLCQLIDEAFDEFGLYLVHHNRWVTSAATNVMGATTASEMAAWLPEAMRRRIARRLARRQSQRCPYLFSVAPANFDAGVDADITPPTRAGFPATHELLDEAWRRYLAAMEAVLTQQSYLLGDQFTLADASAYGQLGMNLVDGRAADLLQELAPRTYNWLCAIRDGRHRGSHGKVGASKHLEALLAAIAATFLPLMKQNAAAWRKAQAQGQLQFNEAAFDKGEALYDGTLMGRPFRSVAKSFQVVVWNDLQASWAAQSLETQAELLERFPMLAHMHKNGNQRSSD
jgi:glutathione S-transferase